MNLAATRSPFRTNCNPQVIRARVLDESVRITSPKSRRDHICAAHSEPRLTHQHQPHPSHPPSHNAPQPSPYFSDHTCNKFRTSPPPSSFLHHITHHSSPAVSPTCVSTMVFICKIQTLPNPANTPLFPQIDKLIGLAMLVAASFVFLYYSIWTLLMVRVNPHGEQATTSTSRTIKKN